MKSVERCKTTVAATMATPANQSARQKAFDDTDLTTLYPSTNDVVMRKAYADNMIGIYYD
jgi:hypothetical protein